MKKKQSKKQREFVLRTGHLAPNRYTSYGALTLIVIGAIFYCILIFPYWTEFITVTTYASGY